MMAQRPPRTGMVWAVVGGLVLLAGVIAIIVVALLSQASSPPTSSPTSSPSSAPASPPPSAPSPSDGPPGEVVDASTASRGWVPEPITTDPEIYITAALEAAGTFDTTLSTRDEWLAYLDSWFTPDTRYNEAERDAQLKAAQLEMRQGVLLPREEWDSLAREDGRVEAAVTGDVVFVPVLEDSSGDMSIGTADVVLTFTRSDGSGGEVSYDDLVRVSVQVLCGPGSVPTAGSAQVAGDCKVVRFFTEPLEP